MREGIGANGVKLHDAPCRRSGETARGGVIDRSRNEAFGAQFGAVDRACEFGGRAPSVMETGRASSTIDLHIQSTDHPPGWSNHSKGVPKNDWISLK